MTRKDLRGVAAFAALRSRKTRSHAWIPEFYTSACNETSTDGRSIKGINAERTDKRLTTRKRPILRRDRSRFVFKFAPLILVPLKARNSFALHFFVFFLNDRYNWRNDRELKQGGLSYNYEHDCARCVQGGKKSLSPWLSQMNSTSST